MNLYLNYAKRHLMLPDEADPVGIILCSEKDDAVVEYAIGDIRAKVFASKYLTNLPDKETLRQEILNTQRALAAHQSGERERRMTKLAWKPWHQVVQLRDDLKTGDLSLNQFAADLYEVMMQRGERLIYEKPAEFFALTYPTYNLRQLAREVVLRLAGQNDKAVRQLALTYGGGKTHTLITLFHLVNDPEHLPDLPAVHEFVTEIGMTPPKARIASLCADKLDVEKGMEVRGPCGETRWLKQPWSVLAYQIAGDEGLKVLSATGSAEERESAPAENLLQPLLALPAKEGLATLVLIDELLMFAMEKIALAPEWRHRLVNFCQYLTQAATKVDRCCVVASLLASDPRKTDRLAKEDPGRTLRHLQSRARGDRRTGGQAGRCRGVAPPVLQTRLDPGRGRIPPARRRGPQGNRGGGPADTEGRRGGRGTVPGQLPVPPRPDGGACTSSGPSWSGSSGPAVYCGPSRWHFGRPRNGTIRR